MQIKNYDKLTKNQINAYVKAVIAMDGPKDYAFARVCIGHWAGWFSGGVSLKWYNLAWDDREEELYIQTGYGHPYTYVSTLETECVSYNSEMGMRNFWYYLKPGDYARTIAKYKEFKKAAKRAAKNA